MKFNKILLLIICFTFFILSGCGEKREPNYGLVAYTSPISPPQPYAYSQLLIFDVNTGKTLYEVKLEPGEMAWDVDMLLSPDKKTGLAVTSGGVTIFEVPSAKILGKLKWSGELPPPDVDPVITPDGKRGLIAHGSQTNPLSPYLPVKLTIFEIPSGKVIGDVPLEQPNMPWDMDIVLTKDGKIGLVPTAGAITIFDTLTAKVLSKVDLSGQAPPVGVDLEVTKDGSKGVVAFGSGTYSNYSAVGKKTDTLAEDAYIPVSVLVFEIPSGKIVGSLPIPQPLSTWDVDIKLVNDHTSLIATSLGLYIFDVDKAQLLATVPSEGGLPQRSSDIQITPDGKTGIVAYGPLAYPIAPYLPVKIRLFRIPSGEEIRTLDLNHPMLAMGIDIMLTPDGKTGLAPMDGYVYIFDTATGDLLSQVKTMGNSPQLAVDLLVTPDGSKGILATGSMTYPPSPYLPVYVQIFKIPSGEFIGKSEEITGSVPWDVDIRLSEDGQTALFAHTGYVTLIDMNSGKVKSQIDLQGEVPHFGVDIQITRPGDNFIDVEEDFINPYLLEEIRNYIYPKKEGIRIATPVEMPERVTLPAKNAALTHLNKLVEYLANRAELFKTERQHEQFMEYIIIARDALSQGNRSEFIETYAKAVGFNNQYGMQSYAAESTTRTILDEVGNWAIEAPEGTQINYQPPLVDSFGNLFYLSAMSKIYRKEIFKFKELGGAAEKSTPATNTVPVIKGISFPTEIMSGEENRGIGKVSFADTDGDIYLARFTMLTAGCVRSKDFSFDPMEFIIEGNRNEGKFDFHQYCDKCEEDAEGMIRVRVVLYDKAGIESQPMEYSFTCK